VRVKIRHVNCKPKRGICDRFCRIYSLKIMELTLIIVRIKIGHVICKSKRGFVIGCAGYVV
jgi:hypothetical protein